MKANWAWERKGEGGRRKEEGGRRKEEGGRRKGGFEGGVWFGFVDK